MREINTHISLKNLKLRFKKNIFEKLIDSFPFLILTLICPPFICFSIYSYLSDDLSRIYLLIPLFCSLFFIWFILGWINKGKITFVDGLTKDKAVKWINNEVSNNNVKHVINRLNENYIGIRYSGWSIGAFNRDLYFIFMDDKVYITSIAVGRNGDASPFHYFMNKSKTKKLIEVLNN